jgi:hypothetical protein
MAGVGFYMTAGEIALSAATAKTIIEVTATVNHRVRIDSLGFFFDGTSVTGQPVVVELIRIGTTGTGSAGTPQKLDPDASESLQVDFKYDMSVEPTGITVLKTWNIHPQSGYEVILPLTRPIWIPGGDLIGIRCTAPGAVNVLVNVEGEE